MPGQLPGSCPEAGHTYKGSSSMVVSHSCLGLGVSKQRVEDAFFQPHKDMAVPTMRQRWAYLRS